MAVFGGPDGRRIDGGPSDKHYEVLASHGRMDAIPRDRREKAISDANATISAQRANLASRFGGFFGGSSGNQSQPRPSSGGYRSFRDMFDGGGPGRSGARFSSGDTGAYDTNNDGYISEAEYAAAEANNPNFKDTQGGIAAISNYIGARPRGSYGRERALGPQGTNIGTSGIANYVAGGGMFGPMLGGGPTRFQRAYPAMDQNMMFTIQNLMNTGLTEEEAMRYVGANNTGGSTPRPMLRPPAVGMNMGGLMALRDYNMGMQMGMGQSV